MTFLPQWLASSLTLISAILVILCALFGVAILVMFIVDKTQHKDAIRYNFPVVGRFRYIFTTLGEFFRQYFFAMDREEMPFNRAERVWVEKASKDLSNTRAFGSTKNLTPPGTAIFVNCAFPALDSKHEDSHPLKIGPFAREPYDAPSFFNISGMSFGALSAPAVRALSGGAKMAGCWMNTGEGGLSRYHEEGGADIVFQIGTAKYGVRTADGHLSEDKLLAIAQKPQVKMIEVKLSQGAKPGKGGLLPGEKVTDEIAEVRGIPIGESSISPNRHEEISDVGELLDFIHKVRELTGLPVGFKSVVSSIDWISDLCEEIHRRGLESAPDFITIDSGDGGTGAAPMPLMDNVGLPIRESLPMVVDALSSYNLRDRIRIIASGKLVTPSAVGLALSLGADFVVSARGYLFALGCIQALKCNKNTCPTGITTHNPRLQRGLDPKDKSVRVAGYCSNMRREVEVIAHSCGAADPRDLDRHNVRIVQANGTSIPLVDIFPHPDRAASQLAELKHTLK
ncbi:MAG: FMN-binding glutamate synthase family protein [Stappiaceae bacterium]